jgi:hypothetical protein
MAKSPKTLTKPQLIAKARTAVSDHQWTVGECAYKWRELQFGTDAEFAAEVELSEQTVARARRVWQTFCVDHDLAELRDLPHIRWTHFHFARTHEHRVEILYWASENKRGVSAMMAYANGEWPEHAQEVPDGTFESVALSESAAGYAPFSSGVRGHTQDDQPPMFVDVAGGVTLSSHGLKVAKRAAMAIHSKASRLAKLGLSDVARQMCELILQDLTQHRSPGDIDIDKLLTPQKPGQSVPSPSPSSQKTSQKQSRRRSPA